MKTDSQLQADVTAELSWEPSVDSAQIGVAVKDGVVTLSGHVDTFAEKWHAERAVQRVSGAKALAVEMAVRISTLGARDDADIARSAENILSWSTSIPANSVRVMVEGGWITLTGTVDWPFQKQGATDAVRYLAGVTGVSDQIALRPKVDMTAINQTSKPPFSAMRIRMQTRSACRSTELPSPSPGPCAVTRNARSRPIQPGVRLVCET